MKLFSEKSSPWKSALWQVPAIVVMASLLALLINHVRSDSVPVIGDWSVDVRFADASGESMVIDFGRAKELFEKNEALFVDARPVAQYEAGHIKGALSLPVEEAESRFMEVADRLENQKNIIAYCDGESCELSHDLALFLKDVGYTNVHVLVNGWSTWHGAGLPVDIGE